MRGVTRESRRYLFLDIEPRRVTLARQRILIVRLSAIGDIVFASPLVAALRHAYPQAHIAWLVQTGFSALLAHHPDLDEVIVWSVMEWRDLWRQRRWRDLARAVWRFRGDLRRRHFDLALDLQGLLKSGVLTWLSGARERVGLGSREGSGALMTRIVTRGGSQADRLRVSVPGPEPGTADGPFRNGGPLWRRGGGPCRGPDPGPWPGGGYVVSAPSPPAPRSTGSAALGGIGAALRRELGLPVVMLGGPADRDAGAEIRAARSRRSASSGHGPGAGLVNLVGETRILEAAALIHRAALVVAVDTGLGHMGIAFARPSLLLFGSTCPYLETTRGNARVLYHRLPCSPCKRRPTCNGAFTCMGLIPWTRSWTPRARS